MKERRRVVATGNTYGKRPELKQLGYRWEPLSKRWLYDLPAAEVDALLERTTAVKGLNAQLTRELIPGGLIHEVSPWYLEPARSGRSSCRVCRGKLAKGELRFGAGETVSYSERMSYAWFHPRCALEQYPAQVLEVLGQFTGEVPERASLEQAARAALAGTPRAPRESSPSGYPSAEQARSGRSKCLHCEAKIEKGSWRVVVLREVEGLGEKPGYLHPACAEAHLGRDLADALREGGLPAEQVEQVVSCV